MKEIDSEVGKLFEKKGEWQLVNCNERADMLDDCLKSLPGIAGDAARAATDAHGSYGTGIGEELWDMTCEMWRHRDRSDDE